MPPSPRAGWTRRGHVGEDPRSAPGAVELGRPRVPGSCGEAWGLTPAKRRKGKARCL